MNDAYWSADLWPAHGTIWGLSNVNLESAKSRNRDFLVEIAFDDAVLHY